MKIAHGEVWIVKYSVLHHCTVDKDICIYNIRKICIGLVQKEKYAIVHKIFQKQMIWTVN